MSEITENWSLQQTDAARYSSPDDIDEKSSWLPAIVPGTAAQSLEQAGIWEIEKQLDFDAFDFWYRTSFSYSSNENQQAFIRFQGLSTIADVWLNGSLILQSHNMFVEHLLDVTDVIDKENELMIRFRSLSHELAKKRQRPRWKTKLVEQQQLRWIRTTLLGRIPGWTPPVAPVGPWRSIELLTTPVLSNLKLNTQLINGQGIVEISVDIHGLEVGECAANLVLDGVKQSLTLTKIESGYQLAGKLVINDPECWWPHTHGNPVLYPAQLELDINGASSELGLPSVGFKQLEIDTSDDGFTFRVNNQAIFCRGACWTSNDIVSLSGDLLELMKTLTMMRDAGANMIRVGGTMIYEQDEFYQACDELGIMVWQDFMFANMDYPFEDEGFKQTVNAELDSQLARISHHACITLYCGNSEIEQQSAMLGMDKEYWTNVFFARDLPEKCQHYHPAVPYISSTPTGGVLPFHTNKSVSHYYGVGAYLRSVSELRSHDVRFTSECLGFSNIPVSKTRNAVLNGQLPVTHHPKWKQRTPRDTGPGWDFEDVRDHYLKELFSVEPVELRSFDPERYMRLSEVVSGEMMLQTFAEWRGLYGRCTGGLVWFLKDFWQGAGWGVIDSNNLPKACYYYLKRSWQPVQISITDESLNGVHIHIRNETVAEYKGKLKLSLVNQHHAVIASAECEVSIAAGSIQSFESDQLLDGFYDTTYAYRFGPSQHMLVAAQLVNGAGIEQVSAFYFVSHQQAVMPHHSSIEAELDTSEEDNFKLKVKSNSFLYAVNIEVSGFLPEDNYFHLLPGQEKLISLEKTDPDVRKCKGYVSALNSTSEIKVKE